MSAVPVTDLRPGQPSFGAQSSSAGADASITLRQLMRERLALSEEPDPHALAQDLATDLPEEFVRDVVRAGLVAMFREEIRSGRRRGPSTPRHSAAALKEAADLWDVYSQRFQTADGWKLFGDFTREDAQWNVMRYDARAAENAAWSARFGALAKKLTRGRTVREALSREDAEAILNA